MFVYAVTPIICNRPSVVFSLSRHATLNDTLPHPDYLPCHAHSVIPPPLSSMLCPLSHTTPLSSMLCPLSHTTPTFFHAMPTKSYHPTFFHAMPAFATNGSPRVRDPHILIRAPGLTNLGDRLSPTTTVTLRMIYFTTLWKCLLQLQS